MIISERIFRLMEEKGVTQSELSEQTGIAQSTISDWRRKGTNPAADKIMSICSVLKVSPYELLQDGRRSVPEVDYRIVTKGTVLYDVLVEIETFPERKLERLRGYIDALKQKEE